MPWQDERWPVFGEISGVVCAFDVADILLVSRVGRGVEHDVSEGIPFSFVVGIGDHFVYRDLSGGRRCLGRLDAVGISASQPVSQVAFPGIAVASVTGAVGDPASVSDRIAASHLAGECAGRFRHRRKGGPQHHHGSKGDGEQLLEFLLELCFSVQSISPFRFMAIAEKFTKSQIREFLAADLHRR